MCTAVQLVGRAVTSTTDSRAAGCADGGTCPERKSRENRGTAAKRCAKRQSCHPAPRRPPPTGCCEPHFTPLQASMAREMYRSVLQPWCQSARDRATPAGLRPELAVRKLRLPAALPPSGGQSPAVSSQKVEARQRLAPRGLAENASHARCVCTKCYAEKLSRCSPVPECVCAASCEASWASTRAASRERRRRTDFGAL